MVDLVVPAGDGPVDLPDIRLESLAWAKMLGKPAAEIEATDLEGKPATLAGYRGKVVILHFWTSHQRAEPNSSLSLDEVQNTDLLEIANRFKNQRLAVLALRDALPSSLAKYRQELEPLRKRLGGEAPVHFLLDRPILGKGRGPFLLRDGEAGSGRTADAYELHGKSGTFVFDTGGRMVLAIINREGEPMVYSLDKEAKLAIDADEHQSDDKDFARRFTTAVRSSRLWKNNLACLGQSLSCPPQSQKSRSPPRLRFARRRWSSEARWSISMADRSRAPR